MYTIPLAPHPDLDHYRTLARELTEAWASQDRGVARAWAARRLALPARLEAQIDGHADERALPGAQRLLARLHGFEGWPRFSKHVEAMSVESSATARFEAAAEAVVAGDLAALGAILRDDPSLIRARSSRAHHATLLHHVAANGIEDYRQRTPANILAVTRLLLDAGAAIDAANDEYGGRGTALGLVATSAHPRRAGVQIALLEMLVAAGASIDGLAGGWSPVQAALANGCPEAAEWLAAHGARLDLAPAAGLGRAELVERSLAAGGVAKADLDQAFLFACSGGNLRCVELLLAGGADVTTSDGQTGLHRAAHAAHLSIVELLLARAAPLEARNRHGGTVLGQTLWAAVNDAAGRDHLPVIRALIAAGAQVDPGTSTGIERIDGILRGAAADRS